ncbi:MAG: hypothetical protein WBD75_00300 [Phycisphaerae bacterium]
MKPNAWTLGLVVILLGTVGAMVVSRGWAEETHDVQEKPEEVSNEDEQKYKIDHPGEEEPVAPESVTKVGETITIVSKTFRPPGPVPSESSEWRFKEFATAIPWKHVDIETDPASLPATAAPDLPTEIKISVAEVPETAGDWPLKGEGNLDPGGEGGEGGGPQEWHWSAKMEKRAIKKLTVWKDARPQHRDTFPEGPGDWQPCLRIAGHCETMASADVKMEVETEPDDAVGDVLWRIAIADSANFHATPQTGSFGEGNPSTSTLSSSRDRSACNNYDYTVEVGFDDNENGVLDWSEVAIEMPLHYVTLSEYEDALKQCKSYSWGYHLPVAKWNIDYFLGNDVDEDYYANDYLEDYLCDGTSVEPQKYRDGHVHYRGLGVTKTAEDRFGMTFFKFGPDSWHTWAIKNSKTLGRFIEQRVVERERDIQQYFRDHPEQQSQVFGTAFFDLKPEKVMFTGTLLGGGDANACFAYGSAGFWPEKLEVTIKRYAEGLGIVMAVLSGDLYDVYDWQEESPGADVQAAYEPACGRNAGKVFHEKVDLRDDTYKHDDHFEGYYITP